MRPNAQRARIAIIFIWIALGAEMLSLISSVLQYLLLGQIHTGMVTKEAADANDMRELMVAIINIAVLIGCAITFIMWFRRAYFNLHTKVSILSYSEGWASGSWFVPIMNLFAPHKIMKEMYYETESILQRENRIPDQQSGLPLVGWWWALWIISNIGNNIVNRIQMRSQDLDTLILTTQASVVLSVLFIPLCIVTVRMIANYNKMELMLEETDGGSVGASAHTEGLLDSGVI